MNNGKINSAGNKEVTVNPISSSGITMSLVSQASALKEAELAGELGAALLSEALDFQEKMVSEMFESLGIGRNVDVVV